MNSDTTTLLQGGSICQTALITNKKESIVRKTLVDAPKDFFKCEVQGLHTLAQSSIFKTPTVLNYEKNKIELQYINAQPANNKSWHLLGEKLAQLHHMTDPQYGFIHDNYIGTVPQINTRQDSWVTAYAEQRLQPLIDQVYFNSDNKNRFSVLLNKLDTYLDNSEPASLIHGDLWNTNILFANHDIYLIDPAVYYASREIEIAYLEFVGDDHLPLLEAY
jgi:fructosamine-3-kinase